MALYFYNKYNTVSTSGYKATWINPSWCDNSSSKTGYREYTFNTTTGKFTGVGTSRSYSGGTVYSGTGIRYVYMGYDPPGKDDDCIWEGKNFRAEPTTYYSAGTLVQSNIVVENGTYPANGVHTDGFWYIRGAELAINSQVNIGGTWKQLSGLWVNVNGVWKQAIGMWVNINGVWKKA